MVCQSICSKLCCGKSNKYELTGDTLPGKTAIRTFLIVVIYLFVGAAVFTLVEEPQEPPEVTFTNATEMNKYITVTKAKHKQKWKIVTTCHYAGNETHFSEKRKTNDESFYKCIKVFVASDVAGRKWSFTDGLFYATTVVTTIGYGNITPVSEIGKITCMVYALIGIPLMLLLLTHFGNVFSSILFDCYHNWKLKNMDNNTAVIISCFLYFIPTALFFVILPALIFWMLEDGWSYLDAVFFSFQTLMTIGFGDYVAGQETPGFLGLLYTLILILWIIFGLAFWSSIVQFMIKAMKWQAVRKSVVITKHLLTKRTQDLIEAIKEYNSKNEHRKAEVNKQEEKPSIKFLVQMATAVSVTDTSSNSCECNKPEATPSSHNSSNGSSRRVPNLIELEEAPEHLLEILTAPVNMLSGAFTEDEMAGYCKLDSPVAADILLNLHTKLLENNCFGSSHQLQTASDNSANLDLSVVESHI